MEVRLAPEPFDPWQALRDHESAALPAGRYGATAAFTGTMRDFNEGQAVEHMFLEHYPGMTERMLEGIAGDAIGQHELVDALVIHRVGDIAPGEPIVLVAVWSAHRQAAFAACREIMEALKHRAPFWKREQHADGARWVERNTPGE